MNINTWLKVEIEPFHNQIVIFNVSTYVSKILHQ